MNRTLVWRMALRYLRGKRGANAVPVLSRISMVAIAVASCAMLILFSVFNGFEQVVQDLYKAFYPEIKITAAKSKFFSVKDKQVLQIKAVKGVGQTSFVIEDYVLVNGNDNPLIATLKGVDKDYFTVNSVKPYIAGRDSVTAIGTPTAIVGSQIQANLGLEIDKPFSMLSIYYLNAKTSNPVLNPQTAYQALYLKPDGVFHVQDEFDGKYILAPLPLVQGLFQQEGKYASIDISLAKNANANDIKKRLQDILGNTFRVDTRFEQNKELYLIMRSEKWAVYAILLLVLLIASFNMIGALALLVLEKQKDMAILRAMGAQPADVRNLFITEGVLWSLTGGLTGIVLGVLVCVGQQQFHWIKLEGAFIINAYPVQMQSMDFLLIISTVLIVGLLAAWYPAMRAAKIEAVSLKST
jgi:lipoprotein-releasing system permease protein